jgi:hypothetical protein
MSKVALYAKIASIVGAIRNCEAFGPRAINWRAKHLDSLDSLARYFPSGAGIDSGARLKLDDCTPDKLVFTFSFHHMNENGYYDGWTDHTVTVRPSLAHGFELKISGQNRNDIKSYLYEVFYAALRTEV